MNPFNWEALQRLQRNLDLNHQTVVNSSMHNAPGTDDGWDPYCQHSTYTVDEPQSSMGVHLSEELCHPSQNFYIKEPEVEDPDGEPFEMDEEDPELKRKRIELREIEEKILRKKVAIALKKVEPFGKEATPLGLSCSEQSATCTSASLKDRVNLILQQRHSVSFLSMVRSSKDRMNSSSRSKDVLLQEDHPLKLRVNALRKQRCSNLCVLPTNREVPDISPPLASRSVTSPAKEESSANQGFQRFLSVLNKGVDMDLLSRIVNDDSEDLPLGKELLDVQPPAMEDKPDLPFRSESQRSNSGASLLGRSRTNSGERRADPSKRDRQERSLSDHLPDDDDDEKKNDGAGLCFGSSSRSKSPPAVKKKKEEEEEEEEEEKPKVDEQSVQLQNILKTLGFSLEVEEMSKLADRTQERLYGKKHEGKMADSRGEKESLQRGSHRQYRKSSSSYSRSTSRSASTGPSHSRDSKGAPEHSSSRDRSGDGLTCQEREEAERHRDGINSEETATYQHPQNQSYPHPAALSAYPDYSLSQYSQDSAHHSGTYTAATNSHWTNTQGAFPPCLYPSRHAYAPNAYHHFPGSAVAPNMVYPHPNNLQDINLLVNPDLSTSEGQIGSFSGPRCLQVIATKQPTTQSCRQRYRLRGKNLDLLVNQVREAVSKAVAGAEEPVEPVESGEEKQPPTEEEIKANLRKKLEAFNQKAKQKRTHPADSVTSQTD